MLSKCGLEKECWGNFACIIYNFPARPKLQKSPNAVDSKSSLSSQRDFTSFYLFGISIINMWLIRNTKKRLQEITSWKYLFSTCAVRGVFVSHTVKLNGSIAQQFSIFIQRNKEKTFVATVRGSRGAFGHWNEKRTH